MVREYSKSARNFILTLNEATLEYYRDVFNYLNQLAGRQYILVCEHIGQPNKHYHIYVQYNSSKRLSIPRLHGARVDKCYGSAQKNIDYLHARDEKHQAQGVTSLLIEEQGEPKLKGDYSVKALEEITNKNDLADYRMYNTWKKIQNEKRNRISLGNWRKDIKVYYIQGPSAIGKSERAEELVKTYYNDKGIEDPNEMFFDEIKYDKNGFYAGVNTDEPTEVAIYDDFRAGIMKPEEFINLIDYRTHNMNIKGGSIKNNYKLIIFTSVQKFKDIYKNVEQFERREQWERRVQVIDLYPPERVHLGGVPLGYRTEFNQLEEYEVTNDWESNYRVLN